MWHSVSRSFSSGHCRRAAAAAAARHYSDSLRLPPCDFTPDEYAGPTLSQIEESRSRHFPPAVYTMYRRPLLLHQGRMQWLFDHEGRRYLDLIGGICTVSVGHAHPKLNAALKQQLDSLWHTTNLYNHPAVHEYVRALADKMPGDLKVVYLVNSGTEANDLALTLARAHSGHYDVITLRNSYHGYSSSMTSLTATRAYRMPLPGVAGVHHAMVPDPYRGVWRGCRDSVSQVPGACACPGDCQASDRYLDQLEEIFRYSLPSGKVAAMFAESIQGVGGTVQYPKGYIRKACELVRRNGGLFISDEVQTGFGRTGDHFWGFQGHGITPDIVTMAKGIGNGFPLAAVVTTAEIAASHTRAVYFNTYGGNALSCVVGKTVLEIIDEEKLQSNSQNVGTYFIQELMKLREKQPKIGDVRGKGLMIGFELVEEGSTTPLNINQILNIMEMTKDMSVLIGRGGLHGNVIRIKPPMCVTREDVDYTISVLDRALGRCADPDSVSK